MKKALTRRLKRLGIHLKNAHCSPERLVKILQKDSNNLSLEKANEICSSCYQCAEKEKVPTVTQIYGHLEDCQQKNGTWVIDWVFNQSEPYLSILDRSTRFLRVIKSKCKTHAAARSILENCIASMGTPTKIVSDQEFLGTKNNILQEFFRSENIVHKIAPRHSPHTVLVERYHREMKRIARKCRVDYSIAAAQLNKLPFTNLPKELNIGVPSPYELYVFNQTDKIAVLSEYSRKMFIRKKLENNY